MKDTIAEFLNMTPLNIDLIGLKIPEDAKFIGGVPPVGGMQGHTHSDEAKQQISEIQKKRFAEGLHPWIGRSHNDESKKKISMAKKGVKLSEEHKKKIGKGRKGKVQSEETRKKISAAMKGKSNKKGYKLTQEQRDKIAAARRGKKFPRS